MNQPTREQLAPHVQVVINVGVGGHVQLGDYIKYTFTDTSSYHNQGFGYSMLKSQCLDRAEFAFSRPDDDAMVSNGRSVLAKTIKDDLISLVAQS